MDLIISFFLLRVAVHLIFLLLSTISRSSFHSFPSDFTSLKCLFFLSIFLHLTTSPSFLFFSFTWSPLCISPWTLMLLPSTRHPDNGHAVGPVLREMKRSSTSIVTIAFGRSWTHTGRNSRSKAGLTLATGRGWSKVSSRGLVNMPHRLVPIYY